MKKVNWEKIIIFALVYIASIVFLHVAMNDPFDEYPKGLSIFFYVIASILLSISLPEYLFFSSIGLQFNLFLLYVSISLLFYRENDGGTIFLFMLGLGMTIFCIYRIFFNIHKEKLRTTDTAEYNRIVKKEEEALDAFLELGKTSPTMTIEEERLIAEASQYDDSPWGKKYFTHPCPYCHHYKVRYATWDDKKMSVAFWGVWSPKVGKAYKCDHCKRVFNN